MSRVQQGVNANDVGLPTSTRTSLLVSSYLDPPAIVLRSHPLILNSLPTIGQLSVNTYTYLIYMYYFNVVLPGVHYK